LDIFSFGKKAVKSFVSYYLNQQFERARAY